MKIRWTAARRVLAAAAIAAALPSSTASADGCSDCGPPSNAALRSAMGNQFREDGGDYVETDGGECTVTVGPVTQRKVREEVVAMGTGEAWHCPEGKSNSQVRYSLTLTSEYEWHLTGSVSAEFQVAIIAQVQASLEAGVSESGGMAAQTEISQDISAAYCHRLPWTAFFVVAEYEASGDYDVKRRFRWWIKNQHTGSTVHASGDVFVDCASGAITMGRLWPIQASVCVKDSRCAAGCDDTQTYGVSWHPPLPGGVPPIDPWPDDPDEPDDDGEDDGDEDGEDDTEGDEPAGNESQPAPGLAPPLPVPPAPPQPEKPVDAPPAPPAGNEGPAEPEGEPWEGPPYWWEDEEPPWWEGPFPDPELWDRDDPLNPLNWWNHPDGPRPYGGGMPW